jgi:hypothetical protein
MEISNLPVFVYIHNRSDKSNVYEHLITEILKNINNKYFVFTKGDG